MNLNRSLRPLIAAGMLVPVAAPDALAGNGKKATALIIDWGRTAVAGTGVRLTITNQGKSLFVISPAGERFVISGNCPPAYKVDPNISYRLPNWEIDPHAIVTSIGDGTNFQLTSVTPSEPGKLVTTGVTCVGAGRKEVQGRVIVISGSERKADDVDEEPLPVCPPPSTPPPTRKIVGLRLGVGAAANFPNSGYLSGGSNAFGALRVNADVSVHDKGDNLVAAGAGYDIAPTSPEAVIPAGSRKVEIMERAEHCLAMRASYLRKIGEWVRLRLTGALGGCFRQAQKTGPSRNVPGTAGFLSGHEAAIEVGSQNLAGSLLGGVNFIVGDESKTVPYIGLELVGRIPITK